MSSCLYSSIHEIDRCRKRLAKYGAKYYISLDFDYGYHQIRIRGWKSTEQNITSHWILITVTIKLGSEAGKIWGKYYISLDFDCGYHQIRISEKSKKVFNTT